MACQKCGSIIQNGLSICPVCGADLTIQSNYKKVNNTSNSNNSVTSNVATPTIEIKPENNKNKIIIALIILVSLVAIVVLLIVSGTLNFGNNKNTTDGELRDIKTVNDGEETSKTTSKKTTTTKPSSGTTDVTSTIKGRESVVINDITFTVPNAYEFGYSNEDERDYYLIRRDANVMISFSIGTINTSLLDIFNELTQSYSNEKLVEYTEELYNYNDYKYYRFVHKEEINRNKYKEHVEIIMQINDELYASVYMYEPENFGEQNYIQTFASFIASGIK